MKKRIFLDTNIIIDYLSGRKPFGENAVRSEFTDFEHAVQYFTALSASSDYIITRNVKDYSLSEIEVFSPDEFLNLD